MKHSFNFPESGHRSSLALLVITLMAALALGCQRSPNQITIEVDQGRIQLATEAETVRQVLAEADIALGELDRVSPDLNYRLQPVMTIEVIRVAESTEVVTRTIPYAQRQVINEALAPGEQRLAQLGVNGIEEITTEVVFENGREVARSQVSTRVIQPPVDEILVLGRQSDLGPVNFPGTVVYFSSGNAWLMKDSTAGRRLLTSEGDLDGRVFELSPDGRTLMYTRSVSDAIEAPLNELWLVDTVIVGEPPISTPIRGVLHALWSPVMTRSLIAYSTAERTTNQPGWRANNDLWLWEPGTPAATAQAIISPNTSSLYAWWGREYAWSPSGRYIAYADADEIGIIDVFSRTQQSLLNFAPFETNSSWAWVPTLSWSPDSRFVATVGHGPPGANQVPNTDPRFDLWVLAADGSLQIPLQTDVGMWSNPVWHDNGIIYGQALTPLQSANSRYQLYLMDRDGSNAERWFPFNEEPGVSFPEVVQLGDSQRLIFVYRNNLQLFTSGQPGLQQLTSDGQSRLPRWTNLPELITLNSTTSTITNTITITGQSPSPPPGE